MKRKIVEKVIGVPAIDGAGVHLVRILGPDQVERFDPFLMLDAFDSYHPAEYTKGFPFHPHRGIETLTYLIKGRIEHQDSLGNRGVIDDGESQWMTAGSGIIHQEMPKATAHLLGLQLWINLPKNHKMTEPKYFNITADKIKEVNEPFGKIKLIAGKYKDIEASRGEYVDALIMDIRLNPEESFSMPTDNEANLFVYIVEGSAGFGEEDDAMVRSKIAIRFNMEDEFYSKAGEEGVRFMLFAAHPLKEPIAWGGPIVMNSRKELQETFNELQTGTFIKYKAKT
ncbi:MAG: pirin family protein [Bacteroides sp.]|nr:pirin family protein [Bacteroides sp.]